MPEQYAVDGATTFIGGQDASKAPDKIAPQCYAAGINLSTENGNLKPRWPLERRSFNFPDIDHVYFELPSLQRRSYESIFESGNFQAAAPYSIGPDYFMVIVVCGIIYLLNQDTYQVTVVSTTPELRLNESYPRINWHIADKYLVFHDWPNYPLILDGFNLKRSKDFSYGMPISVMGTYNQNRSFISDAGRVFTGGDPVGNPLTPNAPITFEEVLAPQALYINQAFGLPTAIGTSPITAMTFLVRNDGSTDAGPLIISTANKTYSFQTQNPRPAWENGAFGSIYINDAGIAGQRAHLNVGADLFFMSSDGYIRSANMSRAEQGKYSRAPVSFEVKNWLKFNDLNLATYTALSYFKSKIFVTANPIRVLAKTTNNFTTLDYASLGMCVMEFDNASTLSGDSPPVWAGLWTGVRPMDFVENNGRMFVISKDANSVNRIYEFNPEATVDRADEVYRYIKSRVYFRQLDCRDAFQNKDLHSLDIPFTKIKGDFEVKADYRPAQAEVFLPWGNFETKVPWRECGMPTAAYLNGYQGRQFREITIGSPDAPNACNEATNEKFITFREVQVRLTITGVYWELNKYRLKAIQKPQSEVRLNCDGGQPIPLAVPCNDDWHVEDFDKCHKTQT